MNENKIKIDLSTFEGAPMYERFMAEQDPTVCCTGTFNVTNLYKQKKKGYGFNALLCYCVLQAAQQIKEFHYSIKEDGLYYYKNVKTNAVINGKDGQLYNASYNYFDNFGDFYKEYQRVNEYCTNNCTHHDEDTGALISTSAVIAYPFTSFNIGVSKIFWDNFMMWGKYVKKFNRVELNITLRFHHATVDGQAAAKFFNELQRQINLLKIK